jgi:hypothetical protein
MLRRTTGRRNEHDLLCLRSQADSRFVRPLPHRLARHSQLATGALRERGCVHIAEQLVGNPQPRIDLRLAISHLTTRHNSCLVGTGRAADMPACETHHRPDGARGVWLSDFAFGGVPVPV